MALCEVCNIEQGTHHITILDKEWDLCGFDALKAQTFVHSMKHHEVVNVNWGCGRIDYGSWTNLLAFMNEYNIQEVLELGGGLSTELFVISGRKIITFDEHPTHVKVMQELAPLKSMATFHHYEHLSIPPVQEIYPGRKWDFVFVDGPHQRAREVRVAMEVATRFIGLHDPNLGEESFFPGTEWKETKYGRIYERIQ